MEISHVELENMIWRSHKTKVPLFLWGTTGVGKSETMRKVAEKIAKENNRTFLEWNKISDKEKLALFENKAKRESSYIYGDNRLVDRDPSDLRGLPSLNGKDYVEWRPTLFFRVMSSDGTMGMVFFDELNLACAAVQGSAYQIIFDRCIGELALNPNIDIMGAGNRIEDKANVFEIAVPLRARFSHITLRIPTKEEWIEWALENDVDERIITYMNKMNGLDLMAEIQKLKDTKSHAVNCPRTWKYCSDYIKGETDSKKVKMYSSACLGDDVGMKFTAFVEMAEKIDLAGILENPEKAKGLSMEMRWALVSAIAQQYRSDKKILDSALRVCNPDYMEPDFGATLLRLLKAQNVSHFMANVVKCKHWKVVSEKYGKYIRTNI